MAGEEHDVVTSNEALALLGVSRNTLYSLVKRGELIPLPANPALLRPKRLLFYRADILRLIAEGRRR